MFLRSAQFGKNDWWRWLCTILLVILGYGVGQLPISGVMIKAIQEANDGELNTFELAQLAESMDFTGYGLNTNLVLVLLLLMFVFAMIGLWIGITKIHNRPFRSLITPSKSVNWSKIFFAFTLWMAFSIGLEVISYALDPENYHFIFNVAAFLPLLLISLTLLPIQTSFEEMFMRGYLMQGISRWSVYRWIPLLITSALFGLLHIMNPEVYEFGIGIMMTYYMGVGLFLGIITLMDDSLELALGVHAATNIYGALFVTFDSSALQTSALFRLEEVDVSYMIPVFFVAAVVFTLICARKYRWKNWEKVYGLVDDRGMEEEIVG